MRAHERIMQEHARILNDDASIHRLLAETKRVAVLGMRSERFPHKPASYVPAYLIEAGLEVVPVPVYEPEAQEMYGLPVYRSLAAIPGPVDMVDVFRRSEDIPPHVDDILAKQPKAVWFQLGIRNDAVAEQLASAGIFVVQDRCLMVEHRRWNLRRGRESRKASP